ncbi:MAG: fumarylacetoacetate hydrolase family protein [Alphaproteobacteria bacterium]|jgi:2-keto-4-pentenoate hydratase/2-oxohepta-3-ene-1,7-dioic acid hydratase in catechol pathway
MKLLYFDDYRLGVLKGEMVVDVTDELRDIPHIDSRALMNGLIAEFDAYRGRLEAAVAKADGQALSSVTLRPPLPLPRNIDCMAVNYMEDGTREAPAPINGFHKSPSAIIGPGETMVLDDIPATIFEGEAELAVIIGMPARHVAAAEAMDHIFGYTCFIDGSARGVGPSNNVFFQVKSRDTFAPIGPYIVTADEIDEPQNLAVKLSVNGEVKQDFNTSDMAHDIARCIEWTSSIHALEPGDILATGTNHRGLNAFQDGDRVELEIERVGCLSINIRDDLKRTWARVTRLEHAEKGLEGAHTPQLTGKHAG